MSEETYFCHVVDKRIMMLRKMVTSLIQEQSLVCCCDHLNSL